MYLFSVATVLVVVEGGLSAANYRVMMLASRWTI